MWMFFLVIGLLTILVLLVHLMLEMNRLDKAVNDMIDTLKEQYGSR